MNPDILVSGFSFVEKTIDIIIKLWYNKLNNINERNKMQYQVCYHYNNDPSDIWYAKFFNDKELAIQFYKGKKECCLYESVKILTIGGK